MHRVLCSLLECQLELVTLIFIFMFIMITRLFQINYKRSILDAFIFFLSFTREFKTSKIKKLHHMNWNFRPSISSIHLNVTYFKSKMTGLIRQKCSVFRGNVIMIIARLTVYGRLSFLLCMCITLIIQIAWCKVMVGRLRFLTALFNSSIKLMDHAYCPNLKRTVRSFINWNVKEKIYINSWWIFTIADYTFIFYVNHHCPQFVNLFVTVKIISTTSWQTMSYFLF